MPVLIKKTQHERSYDTTLESMSTRELSEAEMRKKRVQQRLEEGRQELCDGKFIWK